VKATAESQLLDGRRSHLPGPEPGTRSGPDRRTLVLSAALELFAVRGYRTTTMVELGERAGIRGPSIYKHFSSKQEVLTAITFATMDKLLHNYAAAVAGTDDVVEQFRRAVEMHVRFHARHRYEAFVGTREIGSLEEPARSALLARRDIYEHGFRQLIERGDATGRFNVPSCRLASYAILDMGMGVAVWYREDGPLTEDEVVGHYGTLALRLVGVTS